MLKVWSRIQDAYKRILTRSFRGRNHVNDSGGIIRLYGLMITKDDEAIFDEWCRNQLSLYDKVVCLDGSMTTATERIADRFKDKLIYLHERDYQIPAKTDHGLRKVVHDEIVRRFGYGNWIMCCHADEFCYHDPRKIAGKAAREGYDLVNWFSLHFYPHPSEWPDWEQRKLLPVTRRFQHYHWNRSGSGLPHHERRLYYNHSSVFWDQTTHQSVRPHGLRRVAPFHPILRHYKVFTTDLDWYELDGQNTRYRTHWMDTKASRSGLPFRMQNVQDLFVASIPNYASCSRFDGTIPYPWNMGEQYRPDNIASD